MLLPRGLDYLCFIRPEMFIITFRSYLQISIANVSEAQVGRQVVARIHDRSEVDRVVY